jgi:hypothetical protein
LGQVLVAQACNPSYSGSRDQEDLGLKPAQANIVRSYLKKTHHTKRAGEMAQGVGPELKKKKKK